MPWRYAVQIDPAFADAAAVLLTALAAVITAIGGLAVYRGRQEKKHGEGPSQAAVIKKALEENTLEMRRHNDLLSRNLEHFADTLGSLKEVEHHAREALAFVRSIDRAVIELNARRRD